MSREHANGMGREEGVEGDRMSWPHCFDCGEEFNPKRRALGYEHCFECCEQYAQETDEHRKPEGDIEPRSSTLEIDEHRKCEV